MNDFEFAQMQGVDLSQLPIVPQQQVNTIEQAAQVYIDHVVSLGGNTLLDVQTKTQSLLQMAQALSYVMPLLQDTAGMEMQKMQMEMMMKQEEHKMKLAEMQIGLEVKQKEAELSLASEQNKLAMAEEKHMQGLIHKENSHKQQLAQSKQAPQTKQVK